MALMPKRVKHRKEQRGRVKGDACRGNTVCFGNFGLQSMETAWVSGRQIEAGRVAAGHYLKDEGRVYIRIFPHKPVSAQPAETRMGKGKGEVEYWAARVKPGTILYEIGGTSEETAKTALNRIAHKLPVKTRLASRRVTV